MDSSHRNEKNVLLRLSFVRRLSAFHCVHLRLNVVGVVWVVGGRLLGREGRAG